MQISHKQKFDNWVFFLELAMNHDFPEVMIESLSDLSYCLKKVANGENLDIAFGLVMTRGRQPNEAKDRLWEIFIRWFVVAKQTTSLSNDKIFYELLTDEVKKLLGISGDNHSILDKRLKGHVRNVYLDLEYVAGSLLSNEVELIKVLEDLPLMQLDNESICLTLWMESNLLGPFRLQWLDVQPSAGWQPYHLNWTQI